MDFIKEWVCQIAAYLIFSSVISNLIQKQNYLKYVRLVMGVIMIMILSKPLLVITRQGDNYSFYLQNYLNYESAFDSSFINEIQGMQGELAYREIERALEERVRKLAGYQGLELTEAEFFIDRQESSFRELTGMNLKLVTENKQSFGMDSPDILYLRQRLADEFEIPKQRIEIQIN